MAEHLEQLGEKNYQPTALRLAKAKTQGQVVRSTELTAAIVMVGSLSLLCATGPAIVKSLVNLMTAMLGGQAPLDLQSIQSPLTSALGSLLLASAPLIIGTAVLALVANVVQVGLRMVTARVAPDWQRLSTGAGMARLWSLRTLVSAAIHAAKVAVVGLVAWYAIRDSLPRLAQAGQLNPGEMLGEAGWLIMALVVRLGAILLAMGAMDYLYQRWQHNRDLKMTRRELLEDLRQTEGDGNLRQRRRMALKDYADAPTMTAAANTSAHTAEISGV